MFTLQIWKQYKQLHKSGIFYRSGIKFSNMSRYPLSCISTTFTEGILLLSFLFTFLIEDKFIWKFFFSFDWEIRSLLRIKSDKTPGLTHLLWNPLAFASKLAISMKIMLLREVVAMLGNCWGVVATSLLFEFQANTIRIIF